MDISSRLNNTKESTYGIKHLILTIKNVGPYFIIQNEYFMITGIRYCCILYRFPFEYTKSSFNEHFL